MEVSLKKAQSGIDKERIKAQSAENVARINAESRSDVEEIKGWIAMLIQHMQPPPILNAAILENEATPDDGLPASGAPNIAPASGPMQNPAQTGQQTSWN